MKTPRLIATEALMQVQSRGAWSNRALDNLIAKYKLDSRDSAFVSALFYGVLERQLTLDACVAAHSKQPVEKLSPAVLAVLRCGIYQLLYMESIPERAAVNESVQMVKHLRKAQASGFVNGVLRAFLRGGKAIPLPDGPPATRLSIEYSCPQPLVELWVEGYGEESALRILEGSLGRPPIYLRVNPLLISDEELISRLEGHGIQARKEEDLPHCLAVEKTGGLHQLPEYRRGFFHVQDKSSQLCAHALGALPGMQVLDACSAPGGKAFTLMQLMEGKGTITATDLHQHRVELIAKRAKEMKLTGIRTVAADMSRHDPALGEFDRVLCDVPCSGLGVIRRKPEIKYKPLDEFANLPIVQYKILENTAHYCKAGGLLLYSTCTLNPKENQQVAQRFLEEHPAFTPHPLGILGETAHQRTLLDECGADGFYMALFRKSGGGARHE